MNKIDYSNSICMMGETDYSGKAPLECDPETCGIDECPVMMLRAKLSKVEDLANKWVNVQPSPFDDAYSDPPQALSITHAYGRALKEILESQFTHVKRTDEETLPCGYKFCIYDTGPPWMKCEDCPDNLSSKQSVTKEEYEDHCADLVDRTRE